MGKAEGQSVKLLGMLGLAARARKLLMGTELVTQGVRSGKARMVIVACDASENTKKRVFNCCVYYECECREVPVTASDLASALGHSGSLTSVAVTDVHMAKGIRKILEASDGNAESENVPSKRRSKEV